jgi:PAS domain-containing protein
MAEVETAPMPIGGLRQRPGDSTTASNAMVASNRSAANPHAPSASSTAVFEFTRRKKWADLLITELSGTLILVLSTSGEVLYCGAAAVELLGWKEEEVIDTELANWMHGTAHLPARFHAVDPDSFYFFL